VLPNKADQPQESLEHLIARCLQGDQAALGIIYDLMAPSVCRLAYSILLHTQDAEDVTQEVMVYAFRNLARYQPAKSALRTWLYTITVSRCRNARRRKWLPTIDIGSLVGLFNWEPTAPDEQMPEDAFLQKDVHTRLYNALAKLSPRLREAIALRYGHDLTYREMASVLDIPAKTAESRVRLAHQALRASFSQTDAAFLQEFLGIAQEA
jgi:RNA polymerase sigma-70 factor, ECF subfamily